MRLQELINRKPIKGDVIKTPFSQAYIDAIPKMNEEIRELLLQHDRAKQEAAQIWFI